MRMMKRYYAEKGKPRKDELKAQAQSAGRIKDLKQIIIKLLEIID